MRKRVEYYDDGNTIWKRISRFILCLAAIFVITATVVVTQRLSDEEIGSAIFLLIGAAACGLPSLLIATLIVVIGMRREQERRSMERWQRQIQPWAMPQTQSYDPMLMALLSRMMGNNVLPPQNGVPVPWDNGERKFFMVGDDEDE